MVWGFRESGGPWSGESGVMQSMVHGLGGQEVSGGSWSGVMKFQEVHGLRGQGSHDPLFRERKWGQIVYSAGG